MYIYQLCIGWVKKDQVLKNYDEGQVNHIMSWEVKDCCKN